MTIKLGDKVVITNSVDGETTHHIGKQFTITMFSDWEYPFYSTELDEWFAEVELEVIESCSFRKHLVLMEINELLYELWELENELPNVDNKYIAKAVEQRVYVVQGVIGKLKEELDIL